MRTKQRLKEAISEEEYDKVRLNRLIMLMLHLDTTMSDVMYWLAEEFKIRGIYRYEIKKYMKIIHEKLKSNPKNDWTEIDEERTDVFCRDAEMFEDMCRRFVGLDNATQVIMAPKFGVGDKVWIMDDKNKPILCLVESIKLDMEIVEGRKLEDDSYYILRRLTTKTMKPTKDIIHRSEEQVYKSLKQLQDDKK